MLYIERAAFTKSGSVHTIDSAARRECEDLMERIRVEDPSYWPYGLSVAGHDDLYMIREASTRRAVGFTGWQEFNEGGKKVGYYSIGILPEYRNHGMAKAAVAELLGMHAPTVDCVKAFIAPHNTRSACLARSLGITVVH